MERRTTAGARAPLSGGLATHRCVNYNRHARCALAQTRRGGIPISARTLTEAGDGRLTIAIPAKGRLREPSSHLLEVAGLAPEQPGERALAFPCRNAPVDVLLVRAADIPEYVQDGVVEHVQAGRGLFLYGNCGTGKDHLAVAVLRKAAWEGLSARCVNGMKLFGDVADAWRGDGSEGDVIGPLLRPDVLLISDPVLPSGITGSNQRTLYRLIAGRYVRGRSTWCTANVAGATGAVELLGRQVYDRLIDDAIRLHCNWPSFRERRRVV